MGSLPSTARIATSTTDVNYSIDAKAHESGQTHKVGIPRTTGASRREACMVPECTPERASRLPLAQPTDQSCS